MRLVHDHELRAGAHEIVAPPVGLDVIERDDEGGVVIEERLVDRQPAFQPGDGAGAHDLGGDVELARQLGLPLVAEVRRAEDGQAADLAAIEEFAGDQRRLHGLADPHVIRDQ